MNKITAIIVASTINGEIGYKNEIPWVLKGDLTRFKRLTMGNIVVYGRNTAESLGAPLKGRINIIVSRDPAYLSSKYDPDNGVYTASSLDEVKHLVEQFPEPDIVFFIGGSSIYEEAIGFVDRAYVTLVHKTAPKYDTVISNFRFPQDQWDVAQQHHVMEADSARPEFITASHSYIDYVRKDAAVIVPKGYLMTIDGNVRCLVIKEHNHNFVVQQYKAYQEDVDNPVPFYEWMVENSYYKLTE